MVATDYWKPYETFVPGKFKYNHKRILIQQKDITVFLDAFGSPSKEKKYYSKYEKMPKYSMLLLIEKWNNELAILN